jgi:hypothetical protein
MAQHFSKKRETIAPLCASLLLLLVSAGCFGAQGEKKAQPFVLNPAKPYAYIEFDHAGNRAPLGPGESKYGYWLRLVNNCRLPIFVRASGGSSPGAVLFDEVVRVPTPMAIIAVPAKPHLMSTEDYNGGSEPKRRGLGGSPPHLQSSRAAKNHRRIKQSSVGCLVPTQKPPQGYFFEVSTTEIIEPGKSFLFSIPSNQLSPNWYIRVQFGLEILPNEFPDEPYSYIDFTWWDLPKAVRRLCK